MSTTYDRLARALSQLDKTLGRRVEDEERIEFASAQITAVLAEMRANEPAGADQ